MAVQEGLRRIKKLARVMETTGALLLLFMLVTQLIAAKFPTSSGLSGFAAFGLLGAYLLVLGIIVLTIAWIGEGFADKGDPE